MRRVASLISALYLIVFNLIYPISWFTSLVLGHLYMRLTGRRLSTHFTDKWATGWGMGQLMGMFFLNRTKLTIEMDPKVKEHKGPFIVVMNHQSTYDIGFAYVVLWRIGRHLRWVLKKELLHVPFVGWACRETKCAFVDRKNPAQSEAEIRRFAQQLEEDNVSCVIFVEGTRSTPKKLDKSDYEYVLNPKPKGLSVLHEKLPDWPILSVTIDWTGMTGNAFFSSSIWRTHVRAKGRVVQPEELRGDPARWLREEEWPRFDAQIKEWRNEAKKS